MKLKLGISFTILVFFSMFLFDIIDLGLGSTYERQIFDTTPISNTDSLLIQQLEKNLLAYRDYIWRYMVSIMLGMGWIMTSKETRRFIHKRPLVRKTTVAVVSAILLVFLLTLRYKYQLSKELVSLISEPKLETLIRSYKVEDINALGSSFTMIILTLLFIAIIESIRIEDDSGE